MNRIAKQFYFITNTPLFLETFSNISLITDATHLLIYQQQPNVIRTEDNKLFQSCAFRIITSA
jgi:hypothetical protein